MLQLLVHKMLQTSKMTRSAPRMCFIYRSSTHCAMHRCELKRIIIRRTLSELLEQTMMSSRQCPHSMSTRTSNSFLAFSIRSTLRPVLITDRIQNECGRGLHKKYRAKTHFSCVNAAQHHNPCEVSTYRLTLHPQISRAVQGINLHTWSSAC